jgi:hypothetical protein
MEPSSFSDLKQYFSTALACVTRNNHKSDLALAVDAEGGSASGIERLSHSSEDANKFPGAREKARIFCDPAGLKVFVVAHSR